MIQVLIYGSGKYGNVVNTHQGVLLFYQSQRDVHCWLKSGMGVLQHERRASIHIQSLVCVERCLVRVAFVQPDLQVAAIGI